MTRYKAAIARACAAAILLLSFGLAPGLASCAPLSAVVTRPVAKVAADHSGGVLVTAGDTAQLSLIAARTAALAHVDLAGAYKVSARAFLAADDRGVFAKTPVLKAELKRDLAVAVEGYRALRSVNRALTADQVAEQIALVTAALTHVNQALRVAVPAPPAAPAG